MFCKLVSVAHRFSKGLCRQRGGAFLIHHYLFDVDSSANQLAQWHESYARTIDMPVVCRSLLSSLKFPRPRSQIYSSGVVQGCEPYQQGVRIVGRAEKKKAVACHRLCFE